ncbi:hypothetical protein A1O7_02892 [Cladophialophora yegresii CBS 114405]|uniref:Uncharacterized protein n=1 Tax=Cladophialophora yegresii CBS 114405 TaxID=1182544 RepID=W9WBU7_9EURO|nr:uncharacterized protein A1O7_02892 [Cladophialophora yegresii CBS 114405]EXJ62455.1 hypothetical protein A1O7_02892 [Cladophialophora yegresii CBS 114405]
MTLYRPATYLYTSAHLSSSSQPLISASSPISATAALFFYRLPTYLGGEFAYHRVWNRLIATSASEAERFWQGVLKTSCVREYRKIVAHDMVASLHQIEIEDSDLARGSGGVAGALHGAVGVIEEEDDVQLDDSSSQSETGDTSSIAQEPCHLYCENEDTFASATGVSTPATSHGDANNSLTVEECHGEPPKDGIAHASASNLARSQDFLEYQLARHAYQVRNLEEGLQYQQSLSSGLRSQLVDCEGRLDVTEAKLREAERQRSLYEAESDDASQLILKLQQELASTKRQLEEKPATPAPPQYHHVVNATAAGFDVPAIMASYNHVCKAAKVAKADSEYMRGMLQEGIKERDSLDRQLHQRDGRVDEVNQWLQGQLSQATDLNGHLRDNIKGLEGQINHLLEAKEVSDQLTSELEARVAEVQANNETLLHDFTNKLIADPQDIVDPTMCTYNEARDLRNQVETAQAISAQFVEVNQDLTKELDDEKKKSSSLQTERDLLNNKCARLAANYEVLEDKVEHWMEILPKVLRRQPEVLEDEYATWKEEYYRQSRAHVAKTKRKLKTAALDVSQIESTLAKVKGQHKVEVAHLKESLSELHSKNIELEAENFNTGRDVHDAQERVSLLESQLAQSNQAAQRWREQCENQAWGDTAAIVRAAHRDEVDRLKDQNYAVQHMNTELRLGKEAAAQDVDLFKWNFAETITKMGEFEAEWAFARAKTDALEERFAEVLMRDPLRIQKRDAFDELSHEQKQLLVRTEDAWIVIATGINLGRGYDPEPESPAMGVWETFMAEIKAWQEKHDKQASEDASSNAQGGKQV